MDEAFFDSAAAFFRFHFRHIAAAEPPTARWRENES